MKLKNSYISLTLATALTAVSLVGCNESDASETAETTAVQALSESSTDSEKVAYSIGYMMSKGNQAKKTIPDLDLEKFNQGFKDAYEETESALTEEEMKKVLTTYQEKRQEEMAAEAKKLAEDSKAAGIKFLEENKAKEGVKTTKSGLQYKVLKEGTGDAPKATDTVKVDYEGKLIDGEVFDSSYEKGEPIEFPLNGVIPGWTEGVQLMKKGGSYEFYIPSDLAYGENGNVGIPPNSTLIFKVELLDFNAAK